MRTAVVTGGSGGIGSAVCTLFAEKGYRVFCGYHTSLPLPHKNVIPYCIDVRDEAATVRMATEIGYADVLINNAGIAQQKLFTDITTAEWDEMFAVHVRGTFQMCRAFLPSMIHEKRGSIVNVSSMWGLVGGACEVHYSAAKAAVIGLTKALAKEVGPSHITVNCIAPGVIDTPMLRDLDAEAKAALCEETPLGRLGTPQEIAAAILYAAEATFLTGQVISPNGGIVI